MRERSGIPNEIEKLGINSLFPELCSQELFQFIQQEHASILGIGCDMIEIERIQSVIARMGDHFLSRIFTPQEIQLAHSLREKSSFYAARFAAKEALSKALGTGIGHILKWHDLEILKEPSGAPSVVWHPRLTQQFLIDKTYLSLSHSHTHAIAFCVITRCSA